MTKRGTKRKETGSGAPIPADARGMMERLMGEIGKLDLGDMTPEEATAYINEQIALGGVEGGPPETPLDEAQELVYEAWEATGKRRLALARRALKISPDCADAYLILAEAATSSDQARELHEKAVEAGERALGPEAFTELAGAFWGAIQTRPYMRARGALVMWLWEHGETEKAAEHCAEMLRLNPGDNQGMRYLYTQVLMALGRDQEALALLNRYKDDIASGWAYDRALLAFRKGGANHRASRALERALDENVFIPMYLLGLAPMPDELPDSIGIGDEAEAIDYALVAHRNWTSSPEVVGWLMREWGRAILGMLRAAFDEGLDELEDPMIEEDDDDLTESHATPDDRGSPQPER